MPIHDYFIDNGTGANVRADINAALSAIVSLNSNPTQPGTMYAYQLWADTTSNLLKIRNGGNSAWITLRQLDGDFSIVAVEDGLQATPSLTFTNDLNTGVFRSGADALAIVTGGQFAITCTSTQAVGIKTANPNAALHVAGNARVGADDATDAVLEIGAGATGNRTSFIDIVGDTTYTDYGLRVIRNNTGANATSELKHRGTGALNITTQEAAPIEFYTTNSPRATIDSSGRLLVGTTSYLNSNSLFEVVGGNGGVITLANDNINIAGANSVFGQINFYTADTSGGNTGIFAKITAESNRVFDGDSASGMDLKFYTGNVGTGADTPTERMRITNAGVLQIADAGNITVGTTTGTKIGTATTQKLGFYNATPVVQPTAVADATTAVDVITQLNALLAKLRTLGIIAT